MVAAENSVGKKAQLKGKIRLQYYTKERLKYLEQDIEFKTKENKEFIMLNNKRIDTNTERIEALVLDLTEQTKKLEEDKNDLK